jgi:pyrroline-5-carboxylate reductase
MSAAGKFIKMDESLIDAAGCISGCGPAFVYKFIIALSKAGENCGIPADIAMELAEQTALGAAKLALVSGEAPEKLCRDVCSPGGTTIEGVKVMENSDLDKIISDTVLASYKRKKKRNGSSKKLLLPFFIHLFMFRSFPTRNCAHSPVNAPVITPEISSTGR